MRKHTFGIKPIVGGKGVGVLYPQLMEYDGQTVLLDVKPNLSKPNGEGSDHG